MTDGRDAARGARFARAKFRPTTLPDTLVARPGLHERLAAGAGQRLTVVVGSAGAGKSVLLSSWATARAPAVTSWVSCDRADVNPVRFWAAFIEAPRVIEPGFDADAADLVAMDGVVSADVIASIANDAAKLPAGSAVVVDDFHAAAGAVGGDMADLVERWPAGGAQLVLASRSDPPLRLHRLRMAGELCELRDQDLCFSLAESRDLLANFGVQVSAEDLAVLHRSSEGWAAAVQMAALGLRGDPDPARALQVRGHAIGEYFVAEVLDQQPPEVAAFMLDTSVLGELTADACTAVTGRADAAALLRAIDAAHLFLVAFDDEQASFRYHHLVREVLRAELRARDPGREQALQARAGEWFQAAGDARRAARHFLAARQADWALALLHERVMADYLRDPVLPPPLDLSMVDAALLARAPDQLLAVAADLAMAGDLVRSWEYLGLLERAEPAIPQGSVLAARFAAVRAACHGQAGRLAEAVRDALAARAIQDQAQIADEWITAIVATVLPRAYTFLEDYDAVHRETAAILAAPGIAEPIRQVLVPSARALAWFESGHLAQAAASASAAKTAAQRLGFGQHFFAWDYLRTLAGLALERRDLDSAEQLTEQALSICERRRPSFEFLSLLDRATIWAARGQIRDALDTVEQARLVLADPDPVLLARADELEALLRLSLGDPHTPARLAGTLATPRRDLLLAKIALAAGDHQAAQHRLQALPAEGLTPRRALERQILLAAAAIGRNNPTAPVIVGDVLHTARRDGFLNTVVTTAPQVTGYLLGNSQMPPDPFMEDVIAAALQIRDTQPTASRALADPLTPTQLRLLRLLPTTTIDQAAAALYISRNTVKTHLKSIYQKLAVTSRSEAIRRAADLRLL